MTTQKITPSRRAYWREYRRLIAARRRAENPNLRPVTSMIAEDDDTDPWRKLSIAILHQAVVDVRQGICKATVAELYALADALGVRVGESLIARLVGPQQSSVGYKRAR